MAVPVHGRSCRSSAAVRSCCRVGRHHCCCQARISGARCLLLLVTHSCSSEAVSRSCQAFLRECYDHGRLCYSCKPEIDACALESHDHCSRHTPPLLQAIPWVLVIWVLGSAFLAALATTMRLQVDIYQSLAVTGYSALPLLLVVGLLILLRPPNALVYALQV